jgi:hypothetical protein
LLGEKEKKEMATFWLKRIKKTGKLFYYNKATTWSDSVAAAVKNFNTLTFGVELVEVKEEKDAHIVVILASGPSQYNYYGDTAKTKTDFDPTRLHGSASTLVDEKKNEIFFAAVFLPSKIKDATKGQKQVVVLHELIHAAGMNGRNGKKEHDHEGIMADIMTPKDGGLIEIKGAPPMPPVRVGSYTACIMRYLWAGEKECVKEGEASAASGSGAGR